MLILWYQSYRFIKMQVALGGGGTAVAQWLRCCAGNRKVAGSIPAGVIGIGIKSFLSHCGPENDSASNINEYQEHFLGCKNGRCVRLTTLPPSRAVVMKSGNLNFLEPSGPLQACNGNGLPFTCRSVSHIVCNYKGKRTECLWAFQTLCRYPEYCVSPLFFLIFVSENTV